MSTPLPRPHYRDGACYVEFPIDVTDGVDGYRVTVGWSADDDAWIAQVHGNRQPGCSLAHGETQAAALIALACALSGCVDALTGEEAA